MSHLEDNNNGRNRSKTVFRQTFKFAKCTPEQRISPEGFLIRDCGCVMRFLPDSDAKLNKMKLQHTTVVKNQRLKNSSHTNCRANANKTKTTSTETNDDENIERQTDLEKFKCKYPYNVQHTLLYQSTFWMEPRVVPVKYTTEINFNLHSPTRRFTETIDMQMKLTPCPYIQKIGTTRRFKTSIETKIQPEYTLPLDASI